METVTVGDATRAVVALVLSIGAWRYMSTFLAVTVFPRMSNDPGARFEAAAAERPYEARMLEPGESFEPAAAPVDA